MEQMIGNENEICIGTRKGVHFITMEEGNQLVPNHNEFYLKKKEIQSLKCLNSNELLASVAKHSRILVINRSLNTITKMLSSPTNSAILYIELIPNFKIDNAPWVFVRDKH
jgi:hypothetical protein